MCLAHPAPLSKLFNLRHAAAASGNGDTPNRQRARRRFAHPHPCSSPCPAASCPPKYKYHGLPRPLHQVHLTSSLPKTSHEWASFRWLSPAALASAAPFCPYACLYPQDTLARHPQIAQTQTDMLSLRAQLRSTREQTPDSQYAHNTSKFLPVPILVAN